MLLNNKIWVGTSAEGAVCLLPKMANRHGMISGATGTGKTVTLQVLAEGFSQLGVPVFMADVKGDLAGLSKPGERTERIVSRLEQVGVTNYTNRPCPVTFWDVFGKQGHPIRVTVSEIGPVLLARLLNLNDVQTGVLNLVFRLADDEGLLLLDLKDLRAVLVHVAERAKELQAVYGTVSAASVGAIQRALLVLENEGGDALLGEPALPRLLQMLDVQSSASDGGGWQAAISQLRKTQAAIAPLGRGLERGMLTDEAQVLHIVGLDPVRQGVALSSPVETEHTVIFCQRDTSEARHELMQMGAALKDALQPDFADVRDDDGMPPEASETAVTQHIRGAIYVSSKGRVS